MRASDAIGTAPNHAHVSNLCADGARDRVQNDRREGSECFANGVIDADPDADIAVFVAADAGLVRRSFAQNSKRRPRVCQQAGNAAPRPFTITCQKAFRADGPTHDVFGEDHR
jgi:hypothetical protein